MVKAVFVYYLLVSNIISKKVCDTITADFLKWKNEPTKFTRDYLTKINNYNIDMSIYKEENYSSERDFIFKDLWGYSFLSI